MPNEGYRFGGGQSETLLSPVVMIVTLIAILLMLLLPRRYVIVPFLLAGLLVPSGQVVVLAGVHLMVFRIVVLFGWVKVLQLKLARRSGTGCAGGFKTLDRFLLAWALSQVLVFTMQYQQTSAFINQCGFLLDSMGTYFCLRYLIRDDEDIRRVAKVLCIVAALVAISMINEQIHQRNLFGLLGGVPLEPAIREGRIRSQGVFQHAILAGVFGATILPLFFWLWKYGNARVIATIGIVASTIAVYTSASSTPVLAYLAGILGLVLWPIRSGMRTVRWAIVCAVLLFSLIMNAPVWFIIAHIDLAGSSSGYHRAMLIDQFVHHFEGWWLLGANNNQNWGFDMWDVQNQFVAQGITGGLLTFLLFIFVISRAFKHIGVARRAATGKRNEWLIWLLGVALTSHVVAFFGANYFDQIRIWWFTFLAMIPAASAVIRRERHNRRTGETLAVAMPCRTGNGYLDFKEPMVRG